MLVVFFAYFYTAIAFDPYRTADDIRKYGGFIPGIRPGTPDGAVPVGRPEPHHAAGLAVPGVDRAVPSIFLSSGTSSPSRSAGPAS